MSKKQVSQRVKHLALMAAQRAWVLDLLKGVGRAAKERLYVLMYHRVDEPDHRPWLDSDLLSATPGQLEEQFRLIAARYRPVSAEDVLQAADGGRPLPAGAVLVTVDDGYRDFQEVIFPTALRHGIRPILFVSTAYVGQGIFWWDKLHWTIFHGVQGTLVTPLGEYSLRDLSHRRQAMSNLRYRLKHLPYHEAMEIVDELFTRAQEVQKANGGGRATVPLHPQSDLLGWDDLRRLARSGVTIAAHTHSHALLSRIPFEQACAEIRASQELIRREIGQALPVFAFPDGKLEFFTSELLDFLRSEGFKFAVTTIEGSAQFPARCPDEDRAMCFPRLAMRPSLSMAAFQLRLTPLYSSRQRM